MRRSQWDAALLCALLGAGCAHRDPIEESGAARLVAATSTLSEGVVAQAGPITIASATVARVAAAQHIPARQALERELRDAVLENHARQQGYEVRPEVRAAIRGLLARSRLVALRAQTSTADIERKEVDEATERHFVELARPESFRTVHALVKLPDAASDDVKQHALSVAEALAARLSGARDESDFKTRAESWPDKGGFEVIVETLLPVVADGRVIDLDHGSAAGLYEQAFARAAAKLEHPGEQSPVVSTSFGFHVLMLLERLPAHVVPYAERAEKLHDEILTLRTKDARAHLAEQLRAQRGVAVERSADSLIGTVDLAAHEAP